MTPKFKEAKRKRKLRIERWRNGSKRQRRLASKLQSCRRHARCGLTECHVCQHLKRRRKARDRRRAQQTASPPPTQTEPTGIATRASDVAPEAPDWLWQGRIPCGKLSVIAGHPGLGKSQIAAFLAATVSKAGKWPLNEGLASIGSVIMVIAEDDAAETVRPRLQVANGDLLRIHFIGPSHTQHEGLPFEFASVAGLLEKEIDRLRDVRLVIIDPITALLKSTRAQRAAADRLQQIAGKFGLAVVAISHLTKTTRSSALAQVMGDLGLVAAARAVFIVAPENGTDRRLFLPAKNNLSAEMPGLAYRIEPKVSADGIATSTIVWDSAPVTVSANDALAVAARASKQPARTDAEDFLVLLLAAGPVSAKQVRSEATDAGISSASLRRAAGSLSVKRFRKGGFAGEGQWYWRLPERPSGAGAGSTTALIP